MKAQTADRVSVMCDRQTDRRLHTVAFHAASTRHFVTPSITFHSAPTPSPGHLIEFFSQALKRMDGAGGRGSNTVKFAFQPPQSSPSPRLTLFLVY